MTAAVSAVVADVAVTQPLVMCAAVMPPVVTMAMCPCAVGQIHVNRRVVQGRDVPSREHAVVTVVMAMRLAPGKPLAGRLVGRSAQSGERHGHHANEYAHRTHIRLRAKRVALQSIGPR